MKKTLPIFFPPFMALVIVFCSVALSHARYDIIQLTDNSYDDQTVRINNNGHIAWKGDVADIDWEIFLYDGINITNISNDSHGEYGLTMNDHGHVVWRGDGDSTYSVWLYDGSTTSMISNPSQDSFSPDINNSGHVVWWGQVGANYQISLYDGISTNNISHSEYPFIDSKPRINDVGHVVWASGEHGDGNDWDIYLYNGMTLKNISDGDDAWSYVYHDINNSSQVVWQSYGDPHEEDIFFYDGMTTLRLTHNASGDRGPMMNSSGHVVWYGQNTTYPFAYDIFFYGGTLPPQNITNTCSYDDDFPSMNDSDSIVWRGFDGNDYEIFLYDGATITQMTDNCYDDNPPRINNNGQVVWSGFDGNDYEVFLATPASGGPVNTWGTTYGGSSVERGESFNTRGAIRETADGGFVLAGQTQSSDEGDTDVLVLKIDAEGSVSWQKAFGGSGNEAATVRPMTAGGYIVAGWTESFGTGGKDIWVLKLDENGNVGPSYPGTWQMAYGGSGDDVATAVEELGCEAGFIVAGTTGSFGAGDSDIWILKLDEDGGVTWQKTYGGIEPDIATSIQPTGDGGYIAAGWTWSDTIGSHLNADFWVLKLNSEGNLFTPGTWQKIYGGEEQEMAWAVEPTYDGGYIVVGSSNSFDVGTYDEDLWVLKLNGEGDIIWQQAYGGQNNDYARSIQPTHDGGFVLAGYKYSGPDPVPDNFSWKDAVALKLDMNGSVIWQRAYGGAISEAGDVANSIRQTTDGGFIMTGETASAGAGQSDLWALKLGDNGEIGSCTIMKSLSGSQWESTGTSSDTSAAISTTTVVGISTDVIPATPTVIHGDACGPLTVEGAIDLPVTGQTECYDDDGVIIDCAGTGQDGEYQMGVVWPEPRFTVNDTEGTISDRLTGLEWGADAGMPTLGDGACTGGGLTHSGKLWPDALAYIDCLNDGTGSTDYAGNYLGYDDWRLPNQNELFSLINVSYFNLDGYVHTYSDWLGEQGFSSFISDYWSSTTAVPYWDGYVTRSGWAWMVASGQGTEWTSDRDAHLRCYTPVRDSVEAPVIPLPKTGQAACYDEDGVIIDCDGTGQDGEYQNGVAWPEPRFIANSDATVTDRLTGLIWTQDASASEGLTGRGCEDCLYDAYAPAANWQQALDYVACLNGMNEGEGYLGHNDWRLPNVYELRSLVDFSQTDPALPNDHPFGNVHTSGLRGGYWTSTTHFPGGKAWCVWFNRPGLPQTYRTDNHGKSDLRQVWPVRGGKKVTSSWDLDQDGDVDGSDLALFADGFVDGTYGMGDVEGFGWAFGRTH